MFPAAAVRRDESSLFRVIQLFKRATRRIQQTLDPGAPGNQPLAQATALHAGARILTEYPSDRDGEPLLAATANGEQ
jgi:hypothetical protein